MTDKSHQGDFFTLLRLNDFTASMSLQASAHMQRASLRFLVFILWKETKNYLRAEKQSKFVLFRVVFDNKGNKGLLTVLTDKSRLKGNVKPN